MSGEHKAFLETLITIILKTPWVVHEAAIEVGFSFDDAGCPFCELRETVRPRDGEEKPGPYTAWRSGQLDVQPRLEDPNNHDPDCLWRLAKEYRA